MTTTQSYRTNRDLFSNYYLDEHLPETEAWEVVPESDLRDAKDDIMELWGREKDTAPKRNESQLEEKFIRPMFRKLGIPFEVEESTSRTQRRPDYGFFETEEAARGAFDRRDEGGDFYKDAVAVADAKQWGRPLDTRGGGEHERNFENPSYQIHVYLQETPARWAVLTDGKKWRLYYGPTSHRLDSYYEIDLPTVLEQGDLEDFKNFFLFFRHDAFLEDSSGDCFLDEVYDESNVFAQELGQDLQDNIYEAIKVLSEGFLQYPDNDLNEKDLELIHDSSLIYLYRLIFVLYSEAEGRDLLDTDNEIYEESYSLNSLKQEITGELDSPNPKYRDWQDNLWDRLDELFKLIDHGSKSRGIPEEDLHIPAYNGGLFRTDPDEDDSVEARFLANHQVGDAYLAEVIELLTRSHNGNGGGKIFVDYSSLDVRHLGSIYEGLLEYQLDVADVPLALEDGEYVPAGEGDQVIVEEGKVHLSTGSGERKATGSYYTPEYVVEYIVEETLGPLVDDIRSSLVGQSAFDEGGFAEEFAEGVFNLKILDPAMGSGHFLTSAIDYLAREIIDAQERQAAQQGIETVDEEHDINWARRQVAQRCIYGVDLNPLAVELAKVSLWLRTLAAEQPLAFLDHHLKTGNSLVGSDIEEIEEFESDAGGDGQNASLADFGVARKGTIEQLMRIYEDFIAIENQDLTDVKEMEAKYDEFERNQLRQRLEAMANVHTAVEFGLDKLPSDAYQRMAAALEDDKKWAAIEDVQWFKDAQQWANENDYFHWKLEYPEVFYDKSGNQVSNPGFDAVIGNPPYVRMEQIKPLKPYLSSSYDCHDSRVDLYAYFAERSLELADNRYGVVISNKWIKSKYGKNLRNILSEYQIEQLIDFGDLEVFEGITAYPCIMIVDTKSKLEGKVSVTRITDLGFDSLSDTVSEHEVEIPSELFTGDDWTVTNPGVARVKQDLKQTYPSLSEYIKSESGTDIGDGIGRGIVTGLNEAFLIDEETKQRLIAKDGGASELIYPYIKGTNIDRYTVHHNEQFIIYCKSGISIDDYPSIKSHLSKYREKLEGTATDEKWYELQQPQEEYEGLFNSQKIVYPDIAKHSRFAIDTHGDFVDATAFMIPSEDFYLVGLLNSTLLEELFRINSPSVRGDYHRYKNEYVKDLPVPQINSDESRQFSNNDLQNKYGSILECTGDIEILPSFESGSISIKKLIAELAQNISRYTQSRQTLNLNLLEYFGNYTEGPDLPDIGLFQPTDSNILDATSEEYDNLRVGRVRTGRNNTSVTISATARYKPEDEEEFETDQWGYTETSFHEAFVLSDLSDQEAVLVEAFVPVAADKADGFANFRESATKTNSLVDRLKVMTLPTPDDVADDLERYSKTKERADELDEKISRTDQLIDKLVYELYGLTDEEIEIVESAVQDD